MSSSNVDDDGSVSRQPGAPRQARRRARASRQHGAALHHRRLRRPWSPAAPSCRRADGKPASIANGVTQKIAKGDVIIVPAGSPHWFSVVEGRLRIWKCGWLAAEVAQLESSRWHRPISGPSSPGRSRVSATGRPSRSSAPIASIASPTGSCTTWRGVGVVAGRAGDRRRRSVRDPRRQRRALVRGLSRHPEARRRRRAARHQLFGRASRDDRPRLGREAAVRQRQVRARTPRDAGIPLTNLHVDVARRTPANP